MNALQAEVVKLVAEYFRKATIRFGREFPEYTVCFDLGGKTAGTAEWRRQGTFGMVDVKLSFNMILCRDNTEEFLRRTVPHEVAHIVAEFLYGSSLKKINHGQACRCFITNLETFKAYSLVSTKNIGSSTVYFFGPSCE